jgi:glycerol-3-phosphate cytidylyltransferase
VRTASIDLFHAGHVIMLEEAKRQCVYLIAAIQVDPTLDRTSKNKAQPPSIEIHSGILKSELIFE